MISCRLFFAGVRNNRNGRQIQLFVLRPCSPSTHLDSFDSSLFEIQHAETTNQSDFQAFESANLQRHSFFPFLYDIVRTSGYESFSNMMSLQSAPRLKIDLHFDDRRTTIRPFGQTLRGQRNRSVQCQDHRSIDPRLALFRQHQLRPPVSRRNDLHGIASA